jgi:hypothetical protein
MWQKGRLEDIQLCQGPPLSLWDPVQLDWHHQGHAPFAPSALYHENNHNGTQSHNYSHSSFAKLSCQLCPTDGKGHSMRQTFHSCSSGHTFGLLICILHSYSNQSCSVLPKEKIAVPYDRSLLTLMFSQDTNRDFEWRDTLGAFETSCGCPPSHSLCH